MAAASPRDRLEELQRETERAVDVELLIAEVEKLLGTFFATWEAMSQDEQRETIRSLVEYLKVYEDHLDLKLVFTAEASITKPRHCEKVSTRFALRLDGASSARPISGGQASATGPQARRMLASGPLRRLLQDFHLPPLKLP